MVDSSVVLGEDMGIEYVVPAVVAAGVEIGPKHDGLSANVSREQLKNEGQLKPFISIVASHPARTDSQRNRQGLRVIMLLLYGLIKQKGA